MPLDNALRLERLTADALDLGALVDSVDLALPVPSCPDWTARDLVGHLGSVHRWATAIVRTGQPGDQPPAPIAPEDLAPWFREGVSALLEVLAAAVPGQECWTFGPRPRLVDFWIRRQPLETAVHRWDLLDAVGARADIDPLVATDGVDEVVTMLFPRQVRLGRIEALGDGIDLVCSETGQRCRLAGDGIARPKEAESEAESEAEAASAAAVTGAASDLLLLLWRRLPLDAARVAIDGDEAAVRRVLSVALTP